MHRPATIHAPHRASTEDRAAEPPPIPATRHTAATHPQPKIAPPQLTRRERALSRIAELAAGICFAGLIWWAFALI